MTRLQLILIFGADMAAIEAMRFCNARLARLVHNTSTDRPQSVCHLDRINSVQFPPRDFIANLMILPVVGSAQRNHEFVAGFAPHGSRLSKAQMVRIAWGAPAQQARLQRDKSQVSFITKATDLAKLEHALVDLDDGRCVQVSRGAIPWVPYRPRLGASDFSTGALIFRGRISFGDLFRRRSLNADIGWTGIASIGVRAGSAIVDSVFAPPCKAIRAAKASSTSLASAAERRFLAFRIAIARGCRSSSR